MLNDQPIGVFDSGVGGTSIWKELVELLPSENTIYLADSNNAPYGEKTAEEIIQLSVKNTEELLQRNCKIIVVACNTATTNAIAYLRKKYSVPFIGIEPAIKPAALSSQNKSIGILATKGTLSSSLFAQTSNLYTSGLEVVEITGTGLVERIEAGKLHDPETRHFLKNLIRPMLEKNIDYLVLGCSHYPYLIPVLKQILPTGITIIDSGEAVARQTKNILTRNGILNDSKKAATHELYTNLETEVLINLTKAVNCKKQIRYLDF